MRKTLFGLKKFEEKSEGVKKGKSERVRTRIGSDRVILTNSLFSVDIELNRLQNTDKKPEKCTEKLDRSQMFLRH